jgi:lysophospholipase L1-like esterase
MRKWIKRIFITLICLGVVLEGVLLIYVHIEEKKRSEAMGNTEEYSLNNLEKNLDSKLNGKTIIFLGSSVTYGAAAEGQSFVELFEHQDGVNVVKEAKSGTTLVDDLSEAAFLAFGNGESYVHRLKKLDKDMKVDCLVCQLSTNDATLKKSLGEISSSTDISEFDVKTVTGAMEFIIAYAKETWGCPVVFYTGAYYESTDYSAMVDRLYEIQDKWNIGIIDLYTDKDFNNIDEESYDFYMYDPIHPTKAGYIKWWFLKMEEELSKILE